MRITRIKLCNFIGIKHGLGQNEVEINFQKKNKITMFLGGNGSGKTTILSALTPFKDSQDDRKQLILDGCEGRKEIDIESDGHFYQIIHIYAKSAQSFITKDGVELNENGGVRTFEDIVKKELGISKDYFSIGRIGSNTKNFIDFTTMERKQYIGNFLNIDDIITSYKIVNEKMRNYKKEMAVIAKDLSNYKEKSVLETEISEKEKLLNECKNNLTEHWQTQGQIEAKLNEIKNELLQQEKSEIIKFNFESKKAELQEKQKSKIKYETELENYQTAEVVKDALQNEINELKTKLSVNNSERTNENLIITDAQNKISATKIKLSSLGNPEDIKKIEADIEEQEARGNELINKVNLNPESSFIKNLFVKKEKEIRRQIDQFNRFSTYLLKYFTDLSKHQITASYPNIHYFFSEDFGEEFQRQVYHAKKVVNEKEVLLEEKQKERGFKESQTSQLNNLKLRPSKCVIDTCPFIKTALSYKNIYSEIEKCDNEITQIKKDIELLNTELDNLQTIERLGKEFRQRYSEVEPKINDVYLEFIKEHSLEEWISGSLLDFDIAQQDFINNISEGFETLGEIRTLSTSINQLKYSKSVYENSDLKLREEYNETISEQTEVLNSHKEKLNQLTQIAINLSNILNSKTVLYNNYTDYINIKDNLKPLETDVNELEIKYTTVKTQEEKFYEISERANTERALISNLQNNEKQLTGELNNLNIVLAAVEKLQLKAKELGDEYGPVETVATALSPTGGIPLIFIKNYLEETEAIANSLLELAFGKDFQIKFSTTDKEFAIQVIAKNNVKPDIKMASQGEVAIATISISLALIEQRIGKYNILCLDEIDGPLDAANRGNFINILNTQIEKLGIEQVFIISHNDAFDTAEMDLVLLKGNNVNKENTSFMKNKNIIFEVQNA